MTTNIDLSSLTNAQGFPVYGADEGDHSGSSVASAGDVNGDGYDDIIIGANGADAGGAGSGTSYIIFGKASGFSNIYLSSLTISQGFAIYGANNFGNIGSSVASAGDVNGDGYDDIIIGAYQAYNGGTYCSGTSYIIFGKASGFSNIYLSSLTSTQGFAIYGAAAYDYSGGSVASAGDVNGDGYDDIIIGAYQADTASTDSGTSYVVFGKASGFSNIYLSSLTSTQGFAIYGAAVNDYSGISVASAGDVNGDRYGDIIIGADGADTGGAGSGISYVIFGKASGFSNIYLSSLTLSQGFAVYGAAPSDHSGFSVASAGDINSDGYDDIIIGADGTDTGGSNSGTSYVIFGKASGFSNIYLSSLTINQGFALYGGYYSYGLSSLASAGDVNGDGYDDIIIGSKSGGINCIILGKASSFSNIYLSSLTTSQGFRVYGANADYYSYYSVASAGDVNGDGYDDFIIGAPNAKTGGDYSGTSYVIFGNAFTEAPSLIPTSMPTDDYYNQPTDDYYSQPTDDYYSQPTNSSTAGPVIVCYRYGQAGQITWADFNGDGKVDLLCSYFDGSVKICLSTGNGLECIGELPVQEI
jgi:hypothetical protein